MKIDAQRDFIDELVVRLDRNHAHGVVALLGCDWPAHGPAVGELSLQVDVRHLGRRQLLHRVLAIVL